MSSVGRVRRTAPGRRTRSGQVLRPMVSGRQGYPTVSLSGGAGARKRTVPVHTLVAAAFLGPPPPGTRVAHLNLDPLDCRASNLAYLTPSALLIRAGRLRRAAILEHLARVDAALAQEQAAPALLRSRQALEGLRDRLLGVLQDVGAELS